MGRNCNCNLSFAREVRYRGNLDAEVMFVGESPGHEELRKNSPFVGKSGRLLNEETDSVGLKRDELFYANAARCRLDKNTLTKKQINAILSSCRPNLKAIIQHVKPRVIVALGAIALMQLTGKDKIGKARGDFIWSDEFHCWIFPTWHPAYVLRNNNEMSNFQRDLKMVMRFKEYGFRKDQSDPFQYKEVESIRPMLDGDIFVDGSGFMATAIDTETQGLQWYDENSIVISYSVARTPLEGWQVYLHEEVPAGEGDFDIMVERGGTKKNPDLVMVGVKRSDNYERKVDELRELCRRQDIKKYFMNQKFDQHRLRMLGVTEINNAVMDIALAAHVLDSERFMNKTLGFILEYFTGISGAFKNDFGPDEKADMLLQVKLSRDKVSKYAGFDAAATLSAGIAIRERLMEDEKSLLYYVHFAHPVETKLLYELEVNGVPIDVDGIDEVRGEIEEKMKVELDNFIKYCPVEVFDRHESQFRLTRRIILQEALFKYPHPKTGDEIDFGFGLPPLRMQPKTKLPSCDKRILQDLSEARSVPVRAKHMIEAFEMWTRYHTLLTRYIDNIEEFVGSDGRLHPSYSLTYTSSGRTGARKPSVQNFPKRSAEAKLIRKLIKARKGYKLMEVDHSMSELRWIAHVANERAMKQIFKDNGDIHLRTGSELVGSIQGLDEDGIKDIRQKAKPINFGFPYGMSANGMRRYARYNYGVRLTVAEAKARRNAFFHLYRDIPQWHEDERIFLTTHGYLRSEFGRKRILPNVYSDDRDKQSQAERTGINFKIQGPSSDYTLLGGKAITERPDYARNEVTAILFIHDAFIFEVPEDKLDKYGGIFKDTMEDIDTSVFGVQLSVPFLIDIEVGDDLAETSKYKLGGTNAANIESRPEQRPGRQEAIGS